MQKKKLKITITTEVNMDQWLGHEEDYKDSLCHHLSIITRRCECDTPTSIELDFEEEADADTGL